MSYPGHLLEGFYPPAEVQSVYSPAPANGWSKLVKDNSESEGGASKSNAEASFERVKHVVCRNYLLTVRMTTNQLDMEKNSRRLLMKIWACLKSIWKFGIGKKYEPIGYTIQDMLRLTFPFYKLKITKRTSFEDVEALK